eukprot:135187_1
MSNQIQAHLIFDLEQRSVRQDTEIRRLKGILNVLLAKNNKLTVQKRNPRMFKKYQMMMKLGLSVYTVVPRMKLDGLNDDAIAEFERKHNAYTEFGEEAEPMDPSTVGLNKKTGIIALELHLLINGWLRQNACECTQFIPNDIVTVITWCYYIPYDEQSHLSMRRLLWNPIDLRLIKGSYWESIHEIDIYFDRRRFESYFRRKPRDLSYNTCRISGALAARTITFVPKKRTQEVVIGLKRLNLDNDQLRSALHDMDEKVLSLDVIYTLLRVGPSEDEQLEAERKIMAEGTRRVQDYGAVEQFFFNFCDFYKFQRRLELWIFAREFDDVYDLLWRQYEHIETFCDMLEHSQSLHTLLTVILAFGNHMNVGTRKGNAYGFRLRLLGQLSDMICSRSSNQMTLLMYIYRFYNSKYPECMNGMNVIFNTLSKAKGVELNTLQRIFQNVQDDIQELKNLVMSDQIENYDLDDRFVSHMHKFCLIVVPRLQRLNLKVQHTMRVTQHTMRLFVFDRSFHDQSFDSFVQIWWDLMQHWNEIKQQLHVSECGKIDDMRNKIKATIQRKVTFVDNGGRLDATVVHNDTMRRLSSMYQDQQDQVNALEQARKKAAILKYNKFRLPPINMSGSSMSQSRNIGFAVGGARDVNHFRTCIEQRKMPPADSITYNGLFYEYYFDTGTSGTEEKEVEEDGSMLFYPSYSYARINKNDNSAMEYYMTVGLNSHIKEKDFQRKLLNLVIVLDQSGSMNNYFNGERQHMKTQMHVANECVVAMLAHLKPKDRFGFVVFHSNASVRQRLELMECIDIERLQKTILSTTASGGTSFESGYNKAIYLYSDIEKDEAYDNRIIFLTDAQPNQGMVSGKSLFGLVNQYANDKTNYIYSTFIGIGLDWNARLMEQISQTRGANYYSVKSTKQFSKVMDEDFEFMVSPLVFNVRLTLMSEGNECCIDKVYGSAVSSEEEEERMKSGQIMKINTLFPSKQSDEKGGTKGGIQLIKLKDANKGLNVELEVSYEDKYGNCFKNKQCVVFKTDISDGDHSDMIEDKDFYDNTGIRKGILLCKYVELLRNWIEYEKQQTNTQSLRVNDEYKTKFQNFKQYFAKQMQECDDKALEKELKILEKLANY